MSKTYLQVQKQIAALQREADKLKRQEVAGVIGRIKEAIQVYGLTAQDLGFGDTRAPGKSAGVARARQSGTGAAVRFRDEAGHEWIGRGPRPLWIQDALAAGRNLDEFKVGRSRSTGAAKRATKVPGRKGPTSKKVAGKVKYRDDQGHSWTGMGPKPRWLKDAVTAGKRLEDFAA